MLPKMYTCSRCSSSYRYKSGLSRHITVAHYNLKYHKCSNCDYRSYDTAAVNRHKRWCKPGDEADVQVVAEDPTLPLQQMPMPNFETVKVEIEGVDENVLEEPDIIQHVDDEVEEVEYLFTDNLSDNYEEYIDVGGAEITVAEYVTMDTLTERYGISGVLMVEKEWEDK